MRGEPWSDFLARARPAVDWQQVGPIICLDPGETTGWAVYLGGSLEECGQEPTPGPSDMSAFLRGLVGDYSIAGSEPEVILFEEYRVRGNKFNEHVGSEVVTIQNVGAIRVVADEEGIPTAKQGAGLAKGFADDRKLRNWGLYQTGMRHANDAVRHGVYFLLRTYGRKMRTGGLDDQDISARQHTET